MFHTYVNLASSLFFIIRWRFPDETSFPQVLMTILNYSHSHLNPSYFLLFTLLWWCYVLCSLSGVCSFCLCNSHSWVIRSMYVCKFVNSVVEFLHFNNPSICCCKFESHISALAPAGKVTKSWLIIMKFGSKNSKSKCFWLSNYRWILFIGAAMWI